MYFLLTQALRGHHKKAGKSVPLMHLYSQQGEADNKQSL